MRIILVLVSIAIVLTVVTCFQTDPASNQLRNFKNRNGSPIGILTNNNGAPVEFKDTISLNAPDLLEQEYFMETLAQQLEERIPVRTVHHKGAGAFGYFEVTHNASDICKASLFESNGKRTPVVVRFSLTNEDLGAPDTSTTFEPRGFAVKFYTDEGNLDLPMFNTPMFMFKDPQLFTFMIKAGRPNPVSNLQDDTMTWDIVALKPELLNFFLYLHGDDGIPDGFTHMPGFTIHTYQLYNKYGEINFARFHFSPDSGIKNIFLKDAMNISCMIPDYAARNLYNSIENGNYPSWTVKLQVLTLEDVKNSKIDPFDMTRTLPEDKYPLRPLGKLVLNRNPTNFFADMEQVAFCPGNLVKGILGAPDDVFKARRLAYKAAQRYRLGVNFQKIPVNCPLNKVYTYNRDGKSPVGKNGGDAPNYYPNSFNGPVPFVDKNIPKIIQTKHSEEPNFEEATERYNKLTKDERRRLVKNIVSSLGRADKIVQDKILAIFKIVHPELALETLAALTR